VNNTFAAHHAVDSRDHVFGNYNYKRVKVDDRACYLDIVDMPLDLDFIRDALPTCHGIVLVYSVLSSSSFRIVERTHAEIHAECLQLSIPAPDMCIVGNMSDSKEEPEISLTDALNFMKMLSRSSCDLCIHYYGVSAKTGHNVETIFLNLVSYIRSSRAAREMGDVTEYAPTVAKVESKPLKRPRISQLLLPGYWIASLRGTHRVSKQNGLSKNRDESHPSNQGSSWLYNGLLKYTCILTKVLIYTLIYSGVVSPPIKSGKNRVHWGCVSIFM
jgi:hypothetical protein